MDPNATGPSPSRAARFLDAMVAIETTLARQQGRNGEPREAALAQLIRDSKSLVSRQKDTLHEYRELRNAIVHSRRVDGEPIADPREDVVLDVEQIRVNLEKPPLLVTALKNTPAPTVLKPSDSLNVFLDLVAAHDFSQAPVLVGDRYELITTNAVARWFAAAQREHGGVVHEATVEEVLQHAEVGDRPKVAGPQTTVVDAIRAFSDPSKSGKEPPAAILVVEGKKKTPIKLCSRADLPRLYDQLG